MKMVTGGNMLYRIHINQHHIKHNEKEENKRKPVITIKNKEGNSYSNRICIVGGCTVVYSPDKPLSCGATVWIEKNGFVVSPNGLIAYGDIE